MNHVTSINAAHEYIPATVDANKDDSGEIDVPSDAAPGRIGSVSIQDLGAAFNATSVLSDTAGDLTGGTYVSIERTFYYQIAGGPSPRDGVKQVAPGSKFYVNVSVGRKGHPGHLHDFTYYHRPAWG